MDAVTIVHVRLTWTRLPEQTGDNGQQRRLACEALRQWSAKNPNSRSLQLFCTITSYQTEARQAGHSAEIHVALLGQDIISPSRITCKSHQATHLLYAKLGTASAASACSVRLLN